MIVYDCLLDMPITDDLPEAEARKIADDKGGEKNGYIVVEAKEPPKGELF